MNGSFTAGQVRARSHLCVVVLLCWISALTISRGDTTNGLSTSLSTNAVPDAVVTFVLQAGGPLTEAQRARLIQILKAGSDFNARDRDGRTPLIYAARFGDLETVKILVEAGAYVRARDRFHKTALMYAVQAGRRDIVVYLAENGDLQTLPYLERLAAEEKRKGRGQVK